jgi:hypothetical protein
VRTLEYLHSVRLADRSPTHVELVILGDLKLVLACHDSTPSPVGASVELVGSSRIKRNPELAVELFGLVRREVEQASFDSVPAVGPDGPPHNLQEKCAPDRILTPTITPNPRSSSSACTSSGLRRSA